LTCVIKRHEGKKKIFLNKKHSKRKNKDREKEKKKGKVTSEIWKACPACNWAFGISEVTEALLQNYRLGKFSHWAV
jgi:hypothetical protein